MLLAHAKADRDLFGSGPGRGLSLVDRMRKSNSDITLLESRMPMFTPEEAEIPEARTPRAAEIFLLSHLRNSDIAVTGRVVEQLSLFNTDRSSLVTDAVFQIDDVLYARPGSNRAMGDTLVVTRPGGFTVVDGHRIEIRIDDFPFFITGQKYVLILRLNKPTGSYILQPRDAFWVRGESVAPLSKRGHHPVTPFLTSTGDFLGEIRAKAGEVHP